MPMPDDALPTDLPAFLRALAEHPRDYPEDTAALLEAADEIERLRARVAELEEQIEEDRWDAIHCRRVMEDRP